MEEKLNKFFTMLNEDIYSKDSSLTEVDNYFQDILDNCVEEKGIVNREIFLNKINLITRVINKKFNINIHLFLSSLKENRYPDRLMYGKMTSNDIKRAKSSIKEVLIDPKDGFHYIKLTRISIVIEEACFIFIKNPKEYGYDVIDKMDGKSLTALLLSAIGSYVFLPIVIKKENNSVEENYRLRINGQNPILFNPNDKSYNANINRVLFILICTFFLTIPLFIPSAILLSSAEVSNKNIKDLKDSSNFPVMYGYGQEILIIFRTLSSKNKKNILSKISSYFLFGTSSKYDSVISSIINKLKIERKNPNNSKKQKEDIDKILSMSKLV